MVHCSNVLRAKMYSDYRVLFTNFYRTLNYAMRYEPMLTEQKVSVEEYIIQYNSNNLENRIFNKYKFSVQIKCQRKCASNA